MLLQKEGLLEEAEPLYREALETCTLAMNGSSIGEGSMLLGSDTPHLLIVEQTARQDIG